MNAELTADQREIQATAREVLTDRLGGDRLRAHVDVGAYDTELWRELTGLGWPGIAVSEALGGQGLGLVEAVLVAEEAGRALAPVPLFSTAAGALLLSGTGGGEHVPDVVAGRRGAAVGLVEHDVARMVVDGAEADVVVLVDRGRAWIAGPGAVATPAPTFDRTRRYASVHPAAGDPLPGSPVGGLARAEVLLAAELVGVAQRALELAVDHAKEREQFGRPIGTFQGVSHRCAIMLRDTEGARAVTQFAAWAADHDEQALPLAASVAKASAVRAALAVTASSLQVMGGIGFTWEHDSHLLLKRARAGAQVLAGAAEHRRRIVTARLPVRAPVPSLAP